MAGSWKSVQLGILIQLPLVLLYSVCFKTRALLHDGLFTYYGVAPVIEYVLEFIDGFQMYFLQQYFFGTDHHLTSVLQCKRLLGYPVELPDELCPLQHPELVGSFGVRGMLSIATLLPVLVLIGLLYLTWERYWSTYPEHPVQVKKIKAK